MSNKYSVEALSNSLAKETFKGMQHLLIECRYQWQNNSSDDGLVIIVEYKDGTSVFSTDGDFEYFKATGFKKAIYFDGDGNITYYGYTEDEIFDIVYGTYTEEELQEILELKEKKLRQIEELEEMYAKQLQERLQEMKLEEETTKATVETEPVAKAEPVEEEDDIIRFEVGKKYFHRNSNAVWECTDTPKIAINYDKGTFKTIGLGFKTTDNEYIAISLDNLHIVDGVEVISSTYNGELRADDIATITDKELVKNTMRELEKANGHDVKKFIIGTLWVLIDLCISEELVENCKQLIAYVDGLSECSSKTARYVAQELRELIAA